MAYASAPLGHQRTLTYDTINACIKNTRYEVRGEIYLAAQRRLAEGKEVILTNVGNPQALGQRPLTFNREVMSLMFAPHLMDHPRVTDMFAPDAVERARTYREGVKGGVGAYSDSKGSMYVREVVAAFNERRDGVPCDPNMIFLTNGASEAVRMVLRALIRGPSDGIMVPVPQYPLYSASIALYNGALVPYYLDEEDNWSLNLAELERSLAEHKRKGINVRALVFINPGNPTGQCMSEESLAQLVRFAHANSLVLLADEVYQENIYQSARPFVSIRRVMAGLGAPYSSEVELVSFHTVSKGVYGECGLRGGSMLFTNVDPRVVDEIYKIASINLSPNVPGQIAMALMCDPPKPGDYSYHSHMAEKEELLQSLKRRARAVTDAFNSLPGVVCNETEGAMYSFPRITLPPAAVEAARRAGKQPDTFYCLGLLEETGLSTVPGSGFGQAEGTFHLRTTILPPEDKFQDIIGRFTSFHTNFMRKYGSPRARL